MTNSVGRNMKMSQIGPLMAGTRSKPVPRHRQTIKRLKLISEGGRQGLQNSLPDVQEEAGKKELHHHRYGGNGCCML